MLRSFTRVRVLTWKRRIPVDTRKMVSFWSLFMVVSVLVPIVLLLVLAFRDPLEKRLAQKTNRKWLLVLKSLYLVKTNSNANPKTYLEENFVF